MGRIELRTVQGENVLMTFSLASLITPGTAIACYATAVE
jgi:hypothetical protein